MLGIWTAGGQFRHSSLAKSDATIQHDVDLVVNVDRKSVNSPPDEFGPRIVLITLDHAHLLRLRRRYRFILGTRHCEEFFLPYLFLNDIPVKETLDFPNRLLDTQLGPLLTTRPLRARDVVESFLGSEENLDSGSDRRRRFPREFRDIASALNSERFENTFKDLRSLPKEDGARAVAGVAAVIEELREQAIAKEFDEGEAKAEIAKLRESLEKSQSRSRRLARENAYLKTQRAPKK